MVRFDTPARSPGSPPGTIPRPAARDPLANAVDPTLAQSLLAERAWARTLDPEHMEGTRHEVRMLRQVLRDAFVMGADSVARQHAEALRRLLRERAIVPEIDADDPDSVLEDGLSADLRRVLQRVGMEMGIDA